ITYTPNAEFTGTDTFTYTVDDNEGETSNAATVEVTVNEDVANVAPVATNDTATTAENTPVAIPVLNNDTDSDGTLDLTSVTVATQPTNGTLDVEATTGVITYTPNAEFTGTDTFTYTVDDNEGETSNAATVEVTVNEDVANVAPTATNDTATTTEGEAVTINILDNDTDSDGTLDLSSVTVVTQPSDGNLQVNSTTGVVTYTPDANFTGNDTFTYTVADNEGENSNPATVNITVNPVEEVPPSLTVEDDNFFSFGSNASEEVSLKFTLDIPTGVDAANTNEIGLVEVDSNGNIISGTEQVIFSALNNEAQDFLAEKGFFGNSFSQILTGLSGDSRLVFYLVPNSTTDAVGEIVRSNSNVIFGSTFGVANASEQLAVSELGNGSFELSFEDIVGGDPQGESFGDLVVNVELTEEESIGTNLQAEKELIDLSDFGSEQFTTEIIATANAGFNNEGGLYVVQDTSGTVLDPLTGNELSPNDPGYAAAALGNSVVEFDKIDPDPFLLAGGFIYAPYLKANGSEEEVYFAFSEANPGESRGIDHVRSIGSNAFAFEDLIGGGDLSYDDFIFEVSLEPIA
ncbi:MAG: tandem-95 repeat protein, partial [Oscillatoria sp. PMC 1051.18]|nr:tandem-95 repeat protein [Oscillatoria sp. PMC 1051.18]